VLFQQQLASLTAKLLMVLALLWEMHMLARLSVLKKLLSLLLNGAMVIILAWLVGLPQGTLFLPVWLLLKLLLTQAYGWS